MINLFSVDTITKELVINFDVTRSIPEFKAIIIRDKGSKGDSTGRGKKFALKELIYIYYVADLRSRPRVDGKSDKEIHKYAISESDLPVKYKVDEELQKAIDKYKKIQLDTPELRLLNALLRGLVLASKVVDVITDKIEADLDLYASGDLLIASMTLLSTDDSIESQADLQVDSASGVLSRLIDNMSEVAKLGNTVNKSLDTVRSIKEKIKKQMSEELEIRGGGDLGNREIPND